MDSAALKAPCRTAFINLSMNVDAATSLGGPPRAIMPLVVSMSPSSSSGGMPRSWAMRSPMPPGQRVSRPGMPSASRW